MPLAVGGTLGDEFGVQRPFEVSFCMFMLTIVYDFIFVPYIDPKSLSDGKESKQRGLGAIFGQLRVLAPQRVRLADGRIVRHYGVIFLATGVFLGVVSSEYRPPFLSLHAMRSCHADTPLSWRRVTHLYSSNCTQQPSSSLGRLTTATSCPGMRSSVESS